MAELTDFQQRIKAFLKICPNCMATTWEIAQEAFPEKWERRSGRGALIGHIDRAGIKAGLVRLPPRDEYGEAWLALPRKERLVNA